MSTPSPPPAEPAVTSTPSVPYGPSASEPAGVPTGVATIDLSRSGVAGTAGKWALRLLLPIVLRAIFRAIFR